MESDNLFARDNSFVRSCPIHRTAVQEASPLLVLQTCRLPYIDICKVDMHENEQSNALTANTT